MRLAATLIVLTQDPKELAPLFDSLQAAGVTDYVVGIDDKSADSTTEWLMEWAGKAHGHDEGRVVTPMLCFPFTFDDDFAKARNETLARIPKECEWFLWVDSDDTIECRGGEPIPAYLETLTADVNAVFADYEYHRDAFDNVDTLQTRHRILRADHTKPQAGWFWANRVHEDIHRQGGAQLIASETAEFVWVHHPDESRRDPERNFRILKKAIAEEPENPRNFYYLGNQHFAAHHWREAVEAFSKYAIKSSRVDEKWSAFIYQGIAYQELGELDAAEACYQQAMNVQPKWANSYFGLGEIASRYGRWDQAIQWGELGLQRVATGDGITDKSNFVNPASYRFHPYLYLAVAYFNTGENEKALSCYQQAAAFRPENEILYKIEHLKSAMARDAAIKAGLSLAAQHMRANEPLKARTILRNLPAGAAEQNALVPAARAVVEKRLAHLRSETDYRNYYFQAQEQTVDIPKMLDQVALEYPRMHWVLERLLAAGAKRVLDIGVGNGLSSFYYAKHGIQVVGIDVDWRRVKEANWNAVKLGYLQAWRSEAWRKELGATNGHAPKKRPRIISFPKDAQVQFHCCPADAMSDQVKALGPFDAVVAAEIIEHVERPEKILDAAEAMSRRVLVTTPDFSYDGPQHVNTNHVQGWSQRELIPLISPRGRIVELHKIGHPNPVDQPTLAAEYVKGDALGEMSVIIWGFNTGQEWDPGNIKKGGIGGSETAVIKVAEELARRNCRVTVYAEAEGVWNGVRYAKSASFVPQPCYLFVSWRSLGPIEDMKDLAQHRFVWSHDIEFGEATKEQLDGVTILALSEWHKRYMSERYPTPLAIQRSGGDMPQARKVGHSEGEVNILVSGNGIDPVRFERKVERSAHRLIFAQSPDRGLDVVLRLFPKIRDRYPDATLEVFYGTDLLDRTGKRAFRRQVEETAKQPGVTMHGRVDQDRLAEEYLKADVLLYPGTTPAGVPFLETYCISVVEAQAAGCIPITPNWGALPETNQFGVVLDAANDEDAMLQAVFRVFDDRDHDRSRMQEWARQQTWAKVVDGWLAALVPAKDREEVAV